MRVRKGRDRRRGDELRRTWLFDGCTGRELDAAAGLACPVSVPAGRVVVLEGQPVDQLVVVLDGAVDLHAGGRPVGPVAAHGCVGAVAVVDEGPSPVTAVARTPLSILVLTRAEVRRLVERGGPAVVHRLLRAMAADARSSWRLDAAGDVEARDALGLEHGHVAGVVVDRQPEVEADADEGAHRVPLGVG
jgi:hypothetical protein